MTGTLICDEDGLYDPRAFNDRLVLGMKVTDRDLNTNGVCRYARTSPGLGLRRWPYRVGCSACR